jgi:hypothetical protein
MSLLGRLFGGGKAKKPANKSGAAEKGVGNGAGKSGAKAKTAKPAKAAKASTPAKKSAAPKATGKK